MVDGVRLLFMIMVDVISNFITLFQSDAYADNGAESVPLMQNLT